VDPEVNQFFTSAEYLQVIQLLQLFIESSADGQPLSSFIKETTDNDFKMISRTIVCLYPFMFAVENPELQQVIEIKPQP